MDREELINHAVDEELEVPSFTEDVEIDTDGTLKSRVYRARTSKGSTAVVQEMKRRYSDEYNVPYNDLKGHLLSRDGWDVWVSIVPRVWEDE